MEQNTPRFDSQTGQRLPEPPTREDKKRKKIIMSVVVAIVIATASYIIYVNFFKKTHVDLTKNISVRFSGTSGSAYTTSSMVSNDFQYDESDARLNLFYKSITYTFDKSSGLSNGDTIKVTAKYNTVLADELKFKIDTTSKTVKVKGLAERFTNASKISDDILSEMKAEATSKITQMASSATTSSFKGSAKLYSLYFGRYSGASYNSDAVIAVASAKLTYIPMGVSHSYYFYTYTTSKVDTDYLKNNHYWFGNIRVSLLANYVYGYGTFLIDSGKLVSDQSQILPKLQATTIGSMHTITKIG